MSDILKNMSAPPRSEVEIVSVPCGEYIEFNPIVLANLISPMRHYFSYENASEFLSSKLESFVNKHDGIRHLLTRPTGYMVSLNVKDDEDIECETCEDAALLINVICSTVEDLYIPNRPMSFEKSKFTHSYYFLKEEVES